MSTVIRPAISEKNEFYISKHRYYELKHFCLQYPEWKQTLSSLDGMPTHAVSDAERVLSGATGDPTARIAEQRLYFGERIELVERAAREAADDLAGLLLEAVTQEISYEKLAAREIVPCCKEVWYTVYRRFFWQLDRARR